MSTHPLNHLPTLAARPDSHSLDLVFIVDAVCSEQLLERRCKFVRDIIRNVVNGLPEEGHLRVGAIAYGPHTSTRIPVARLSTNIDSIQRFLRAQDAHPGGPFEAAYEEVLYGLYDLNWGPVSHRVILTVGYRPPHPYRPWAQSSGDPFDCYNQQFCEKGFDWWLLLAPLRSYLRLHSIVIVCPSNWHDNSALTYTDDYAEFCWREIGYTNLFSLNSTTAGEVARDILQLV
jgi:hypothetical protein